MPTKIYILSFTHILFKINMSLIQTTRDPPEGRASQFGNLWLNTFTDGQPGACIFAPAGHVAVYIAMHVI
jgi:hypothetical protein